MDPLDRRRFLTTAASGAVALVIAGCAPGTPDVPVTPAIPTETLRYGTASPYQVADLYLPAAPARTGPLMPSASGALPVVVLIHGGYWLPTFDRTLMTPLVGPLLAEGWAVLNLEYRPLGLGGGWPATYLDVALGMDLLAGQRHGATFDPRRILVVGHSAGGALALWSAGRHTLPRGVPGSRPKVDVRAVVSLAGLTDLEACALENLGGGACTNFMGAPPGAADHRYEWASPRRRLPIARPQLIVHGTWDLIVPIRQSRDYIAAAHKAGDPAELRVAHAVEHLGVIDPTRSHWRYTMAWLRTQARSGLP